MKFVLMALATIAGTADAKHHSHAAPKLIIMTGEDLMNLNTPSIYTHK